jgi:uncharacterized protein with PIN domain
MAIWRYADVCRDVQWPLTRAGFSPDADKIEAIDRLWRTDTCPYCKGALVSLPPKEEVLPEKLPEQTERVAVQVFVCGTCGWWKAQ